LFADRGTQFVGLLVVENTGEFVKWLYADTKTAFPE